MAQVKVNREAPEPPPIKDVVISLSEREAVSLANLLGWGVGATTLSNLGLVQLNDKLEHAGIRAEDMRFRHTAVMRSV